MELTKSKILDDPVTIIHLDCCPEFRCVVKSLLSDDRDLVVIGEGDTFTAAIELIKNLEPKVLLTCVRWKDGSALKDLPHVKELFPNLKIIVLTMMFSRSLLKLVFDSGQVDGFIGKHADVNDLKITIKYAIENRPIYFVPTQV